MGPGWGMEMGYNTSALPSYTSPTSAHIYRICWHSFILMFIKRKTAHISYQWPHLKMDSSFESLLINSPPQKSWCSATAKLKDTLKKFQLKVQSGLVTQPCHLLYGNINKVIPSRSFCEIQQSLLQLQRPWEKWGLSLMFLGLASDDHRIWCLVLVFPISNWINKQHLKCWQSSQHLWCVFTRFLEVCCSFTYYQ